MDLPLTFSSLVKCTCSYEISVVQYNFLYNFFNVVFLFTAQETPMGEALLIHEVSRSHTTTHHSQ